MSNAMTAEETTSYFETPLGTEEVYLRLLDELQPAPVEFSIGAARIFYGIHQHLPDFEGMDDEKALLTNALTDAVYPLVASLYAQAVSIKMVMLNGTTPLDWSQHKVFASCTIFDLDRHSRIHYVLTPDDPDMTKILEAHHGLAIICEPLSYNYHRLKDDRKRFAKMKQNIWEWTERKVGEWYELKKPLPTINPNLLLRTPPVQGLKESLAPIIEAVVAAIITALPAALVTDGLKEKIALAVRKPLQPNATPTTTPAAPQQVPLIPAVLPQTTPVSLAAAQALTAQQVRPAPQTVPQSQTTAAIPMAIAAIPMAMPAATKPASIISAQPVLSEQTPPLHQASLRAQPISIAAHPAAQIPQPAAEPPLVKPDVTSTPAAAQIPVTPMPTTDAIGIKAAATPVVPSQKFSVAQVFHKAESITDEQAPVEIRPAPIQQELAGRVAAQPEPTAPQQQPNQQPQQQPRQERAPEQTAEQQPEAKPAQASNKEAPANQPEPQKGTQTEARTTAEPQPEPEPTKSSSPTKRQAQPTEHRAEPAPTQQTASPTPAASPHAADIAPEQNKALTAEHKPASRTDVVTTPAEEQRLSATPQPRQLHSEQEYDLLKTQPQHHVYADLSPEHVLKAQTTAPTPAPQPEATAKPAPQPKLKSWFRPKPKVIFPTPTPTPTGFGGIFGWWKK